MAGPIYVEGTQGIARASGLGAFIIEADVTGKPTFQAAGLSSGDTFYYTAVNLDNPKQTETGLGTINADGSIERSCMRGGCVDFTAGDKLVSMIQLAPQPVLMIGGATGGSSDGLTDDELRAAPIAISGAVAVTNWPGFFDVSNFPASFAVSNFPNSQAVTGPLTDSQLRASAVPVSGAFYPATQPVSIAATVAVSGPLTDVQLRASAVPISVAATLATRNLKDASRTLFGAATVIAGVAAVTAEALLSLVPVRAGVAGSAGTSIAVTSGKTLRITAIEVSSKSSSAAVLSARFALRMNPNGAATASSPIIAILNTTQQAAALAEAGDTCVLPLPDGIEISGTQQLGLTQICSATSGLVWASIIGFEY